jgi:hypothetical protein
MPISIVIAAKAKLHYKSEFRWLNKQIGIKKDLSAWCVVLMVVFPESKDSLSTNNELNVVPLLRILNPLV